MTKRAMWDGKADDLVRSVLDLVLGYLVTVWLFVRFRHPGFVKDLVPGVKPSHVIVATGFLFSVATHWWLVDIPSAVEDEDIVMPLLSALLIVANLPLFGGAALVLAFMAFSAGLNSLSMIVVLLVPQTHAELKWVTAFAEMTFVFYYGFIVKAATLPGDA